MPAARDISRDAVVVVPGIMGSELVDRFTGAVRWGLSDPRWYVSAWTSGQALRALRVTESDLAGRARLRATRLLRGPAFAPVLRGIEPYCELVTQVRRVVAHPAAVLEFPYDWRLSIADAAAALAAATSAHLDSWRAHPQGSSHARIVIVAHSMGGLIAHYFTTVLGGAEVVRSIVTLGTPFYGAVKAVRVLATGAGGPLPLPHRRLRDLAVTLPGIYDLLPTYRCVDEGTGPRRLTTSDLSNVGADPTLASASAAVLEKLAGVPATKLHPVVGVGQPTMQSLRIRDGSIEMCYYACEPDDRYGVTRVDRLGDSTVYRDAASPAGVDPSYLPQSHAMLARSPEAMAHVRSVITQRPLGPPLGVGSDETPVGIDLPDVVAVGRPFEVTIRSTDPAGVSCRVWDASSHEVEALPRVTTRDGTLAAELALSRPGIFRVEVAHGSYHPISQLMMVVPEAELAGDTADA
jgi:hypothetical protein